MKDVSFIVEDFEESIFATMSTLAKKHNAINLAQGFPNFDGPDFIKSEAIDYIRNGFNQYAPYKGICELRESVSFYLNYFYHFELDADKEITITTGATEGIFSAVFSLVNPGDEVLVIEPYYDSYVTAVKMAGGIPIFCSLDSHFNLSLENIKNKITSKTKLLIINNPHNPTGKVYDLHTLEQLALIICTNDLYVISDEVYEFLYFDKSFIPLQKIKSLKNRCITLSSAGKTFGLTGWKIGWAYGPERLISLLSKVRQYTTFSVSTPMQFAMSKAIRKLPQYVSDFQISYKSKRDLLATGLSKCGFEVYPCDGTYFLIARYSSISDKKSVEFSKELIEKYQVATVPLSPFYSKGTEGDHLIRFCFAKTEEVINNALKNLNFL